MKVNLFIKLFSYLKEIKIEQSTSEYNPLLMVTLKKGRYRLLTENAIYSYEDLYDNFHKALQSIHIKAREFEEVLLLGLGLGSVPFMLEKTFNKKCFITAVELDEEVIRLASKYTLSQLKNPFDIICADASVFVQITEQRFDLICVDVFNDDIIPDSIYVIDFVEAIKELLNPRGILLFNVLAYTENDIVISDRFFNTTFRKVFPNSEIIRTDHNYILLNDSKFL